MYAGGLVVLCESCLGRETQTAFLLTGIDLVYYVGYQPEVVNKALAPL